MTKIDLSIFRLLILLTYFSCKNNSTPSAASRYNYNIVEILLKSPTACQNKILLNSSGLNKCMFGIVDFRTKKINVKLESSFVIPSDSVQIKINRMIEDIRNRKLVSSSPGQDLYQSVISIDGKIYIDKYGGDSLLDRLLLSLSPYVSVHPKFKECDYFYYLKQSVDSSR